jgi:hypothetical protein
MKTPEYERSRDERKRVEMRFAHLKTHHRFERMRLRGLTGARDEFHLAAIAQNLKTSRSTSRDHRYDSLCQTSRQGNPANREAAGPAPSDEAKPKINDRPDLRSPPNHRLYQQHRP